MGINPTLIHFAITNIMTHQEHNGIYLLRLMPGEELVETLTAFCKEQKLTGGFISGLGAVSEVELAHFNVRTKKYSTKTYTGEYEISNITGNISAEKNHLHITIGDDTFVTYAGHCNKAVADPTIEIMITPFSETHRVEDEYSSLDLLDLPNS